MLENFSNFRILSFDCYGTLIDWEKGIIDAMVPFFLSRNVRITDETILELFAKFESESGNYIEYKEVLKRVFKNICESLSIRCDDKEQSLLLESFEHWEPFPDTVEALNLLKKHFKLAIISNVDDDLFEMTRQKLGVNFDYIITAQQVKSYKPSPDVFKYAFKKFCISKDQVLHIAQSLYHDIKPAKDFGLSTVWVNRRMGRKGNGATPFADASPDLEVPDLITLAQLIENTAM
ncbi:haloacid dehalogenase type II [Bacteroidetes/Chlorobi group bacterium Naka2016]|jgi:2-haloacid dehalogenase|nr:MAG: haloacid dehalogenase type II [Bacteroidetes/Chlorobi group bacterium Naka2016]